MWQAFLVEAGLPEKQGLKHWYPLPFLYERQVEAGLPEKQGLKQVPYQAFVDSQFC